MASLKITLEQHTPLIFFKPTEVGTLLSQQRLVSALDEFIIKKMAELKEPIPDIWKSYGHLNDSNENSIDENIEAKNLALNYKVKIRFNQEIENQKIDRNFLYFGNMGLKGEEIEKKEKAFRKVQKVEVTFYKAHQTLIDFIEKNIAAFFAKTSFGTRSSKGFGSFYLTKDSSGFKEIKDVLKDNYYLEFIPTSTDESKMHEQIEHCINYYYKRLKSGLSKNGFGVYEKAIFPDVLKKENLVWEKREIKRTETLIFEKGPVPVNYNENKEDKAVFARILLGLPESITFNEVVDDRIVIGNTQKIAIKAINHETQKDDEKIQRFASPILFKPFLIDNNIRIYIIHRNLTNEEIETLRRYDFWFIPPETFTLKIRVKRNPKNGKQNELIFETEERNSKSKLDSKQALEMEKLFDNQNITTFKDNILKRYFFYDKRTNEIDQNEWNKLFKKRHFVVGQIERMTKLFNIKDFPKLKMPDPREIKSLSTEELLKEHHRLLNNTFEFKEGGRSGQNIKTTIK